MKNKKILLITIVILLIIAFSSISINAAEYKALINADPATFYIEYDGELTWSEYIDTYKPQGFTYSSDGVYYYEMPLWYWYQPDLIHLPYETYVYPEDYIFYNITYNALERCEEHEATRIDFITHYPCQSFEGRYKCLNCGYVWSEFHQATVPHSFGVELESYISPTCTSPGYSIKKCVYCGTYETFEGTSIDPTAHLFIDATCTEPSYCKYCKITKGEPLGHDMYLDIFCKRDGCSYNTGAKYGKELREGFENVGQAIGNALNDGVEKVEEAGTIIYEYIFPGEDGKGLGANTGFTGNEDSNSPSWKEIFNVAKWVLFIIPMIFVGYFVIKYSIKIKREVEKNKTNKKGK